MPIVAPHQITGLPIGVIAFEHPATTWQPPCPFLYPS